MPRVTVVIDAEMLARLDADARMLGTSRSEALRRRLDETGPVSVPEAEPSPSREATLAMLQRAAARGSVVAMATLARELRLQPQSEQRPEALVEAGPISLDELRRELRGVS